MRPSKKGVVLIFYVIYLHSQLIMKKILFAVIAVTTLAACKKGTTITYRITNNSGEQISFTTYYNYSTAGTHSAIVNNGDTREILIISKTDGRFDKGYDAGDGIDSIVGITHTGKRLHKDLANGAHWSKVTTKKQRLHTLTTEIAPKDIQ